ncbi:ABC transporter permease [Sphingomonas sp. ABOLG]|uniref:ABC transporter permease n=1 Tax=Sphingomonas olei TaxID=1886787 RepID=A0ABY2QMU4_9SPHN|nr:MULTISPECIES: ABC transporter permease [Sphingomonas]RSV18619.1 ABC transporter permease [Sphingomonas sp. ABOLG]THG42260.1 ABC transporter permease [Sphingomonas olei]
MSFLRALEQTLLTIIRTRELLMLAVVSVLFYAVYYPAPYQQQTATDIALVVVDADRSPMSRALVRHLSDTRAVFVVVETGNLGEARELVRARKADGVVYLAPHLQQRVLSRGGGTGIALWLNGAYFVRAEAIGETLGQVALDALDELAQTVPAIARQRAPEVLVQPIFTTGGYRDYVFPAVANIILQQTLLAASARLVADRRQRGWTVMRRAEALGMLAAAVLVGVLTTGFYFGFVYWAQGVPRGGNMPGLLLAIPPFAVAVAGLGMVLGSLFRAGDDALKVLLPTSLPLLFLGGFAWPLYAMPQWLATGAWLSPATPATHLFIRFNQMGATLAEAWGPFCVMAGLAACYTAGFLWRVRRLNAEVCTGGA